MNSSSGSLFFTGQAIKGLALQLTPQKMKQKQPQLKRMKCLVNNLFVCSNQNKRRRRWENKSIVLFGQQCKRRRFSIESLILVGRKSKRNNHPIHLTWTCIGDSLFLFGSSWLMASWKKSIDLKCGCNKEMFIGSGQRKCVSVDCYRMGWGVWRKEVSDTEGQWTYINVGNKKFLWKGCRSNIIVNIMNELEVHGNI